MNNDTKKMAVELLAGWLTEIHQQNKAIRRKNKLIKRLRSEAEAKAVGTTREFSLHNAALHTLATAMDMGVGQNVRDAVDQAIVQLALLQKERDALGDQLIIMGGELTRERGEHEDEVCKLEAQLRQLRSAHGDLVKRNALLRERPDLPVDRIPAHDELVRERSANDVFVAMLKEAYKLFYEQDVCAGASIAHGSFGRRLKKIIDDGPFGVVMPPEPLREGDNVHITMGNGETVDCVVSEAITMKPMNVEGTLTGRMTMPLPTAYGGCTCECHRTPGVLHVAACCGPGMGNLASKPPTEEAYAIELEEAEEALGAWMSAALGDGNTCQQMKDDINRWFAAMASCTERYPTAWAYENVCKALDMKREQLEAAQKQIERMKHGNSQMYLRVQRCEDQLNSIREALRVQ